jgi:hypothetical protein
MRRQRWLLVLAGFILATQSSAFGQVSWDYRHRRAFRVDPYEDGLIGGLTQNHWWRNWLGPLAPAQASAINKLDVLIAEALDHAFLAAADYMDTNPPDYLEFAGRLQRRLHETRRHAERMVALGLLTEPQAALVMQKYLTGSNRLVGLYDENVQELLGMTASQKEQLVKIGREATRRDGLLGDDPNLKTAADVGQAYAAIRKEAEEAAMNVLTRRQRKIWSRLTTAPVLPAKPPDLPAPSEAEAARIKIKDVSPVFRVLADKADAFKLSDPQKKFLRRLEEITRDGLYWISLRKSKDAQDQVSKARAEFVKQAELVAIFGILTDKQAEQLQAAMKK